MERLRGGRDCCIEEIEINKEPSYSEINTDKQNITVALGLAFTKGEGCKNGGTPPHI